MSIILKHIVNDSDSLSSDPSSENPKHIAGGEMPAVAGPFTNNQKGDIMNQIYQLLARRDVTMKDVALEIYRSGIRESDSRVWLGLQISILDRWGLKGLGEVCSIIDRKIHLRDQVIV